MDIFSILTLAGGLAFFLYGMNVMSSGLERMAGGKLEGALKQMTSNRFKGLFLGAGVTAAIQSSSALTVMLVGLVNSGIMNLRQSIGVIMGSNIGTTVTAWFLSMVGIESDNLWINFLKPENFSLIFALVGIFLIMSSKDSKKREIGSILVGFAVLMYGMKLMGGAVEPLANSPEFAQLLIAFENPVFGVLAGALLTGIIQSSSASVGILQALSLTGSITYGMAIPIIMGQNIGTCITSLISSIGVSTNAKKVAVVHISFNLIGTAVWLSVFYLINAVFPLSFVGDSIGVVGVAVVHSIFNILTTVLLVPFTPQLERIANAVLKEKDQAAEAPKEFLDARLFETPSVAISECNNKASEMSILARDTLFSAIGTVSDYDEETAKKILQNEDMLDLYEDRLSSYLVKLSSNAVSAGDSLKISKMLHAIGNLERLGDHAVNILEVSEELHNKRLWFSEQATAELKVLTSAIEEILTLTTDAYTKEDVSLAERVEPLEEVIDNIIADVKAKHVQRLQTGQCTIEMGFILSDLLNNYERVSDHCSNIAVTIIELAHNSFDTHKYLNSVKFGNSKFNSDYEEFSKKYEIKE